MLLILIFCSTIEMWGFLVRWIPTRAIENCPNKYHLSNHTGAKTQTSSHIQFLMQLFYKVGPKNISSYKAFQLGLLTKGTLLVLKFVVIMILAPLLLNFLLGCWGLPFLFFFGSFFLHEGQKPNKLNYNLRHPCFSKWHPRHY